MGFQEIVNNFLNRAPFQQGNVPGYVLDDYERSQQEITEKIAAQKQKLFVHPETASLRSVGNRLHARQNPIVPCVQMPQERRAIRGGIDFALR